MNCIQLNGDVELIPLILSRVAKRTQGMVCPPNQRTVVHNVPTSVILIAPTLLAVRFTPPLGVFLPFQRRSRREPRNLPSSRIRQHGVTACIR